MGLSFHAVGGKVFVDECDEGFPFLRAGVRAPSILLKIDGKKVETREDVLEIVVKLKSSSSAPKFTVEIDTRKESQLWIGAPVEVDIDREWENGIIAAINKNGTFDIQLTCDDEMERDIDFDDIRLRKVEIKEATSNNNSAGPTSLPPATMPDHEGVMKKQGADIVGLYKLRRFALYEQALYYFHTNSKTSKPLGVLDLKGAMAMSDPKRGKV